MTSTVRRSIRLRWSALLVAGGAVGALLGPAGAVPAGAATTPDRCAAVVHDGAKVLGKATRVTRSAATLTREGATVRVRTYRTVPGGDLDAAVAAEVARCPGWQDGDGRRRPDLLVLAVSTGDRKVATSFGSRWTEVLEPVWLDVQEERVAPLLRRKQYATALAAGLDGLHTAVTLAASDSGVGGDLEPGSTSGTYPPDTMPFVGAEPGGAGFGGGFVLVLILGGLFAAIAAVARSSGLGGSSSGSGSSWGRSAHRSTLWSSSHASESANGSFGSSHGSSGSSGHGSSGSSGSGSSDGGGGGSSSY